MANNGGNITFGINFNVNKSGLNDLKKSLQDIQKSTSADLVGNLGSAEAKKALEEVKRSASEIEKALQKAYNPTINSVNVSKFNQQLSKTGINLNTVYQSFSKVQGGSSVFRNLTTQLLTTNMQLKETHSLLDSMGQTMVNTVKWGIASSIMNTFTGSIQNAYNYVKVLDSSLTDIRIVTGQSREEMDKFADSANKAAQNLGRQTKDYTNAALSFYQQGLSEDEVAARTETTLKAANITGAGVSDMANQLTAVWNGFQTDLSETENVVSKLAAVADSSASNMSELATAMSKTASVANNMGVNVDQLTAQVATIIATTRQAPETVGNALKTIYARINDIKAGSDEAQISLGNYTGKMAALGVQVLDQQGHLRDTGDVMTQIGERWGDMTREQQIYLAQTMAGQRQMNNLIALFDNWDIYTKELNTSLEAQGTLDEKNARYMESLAAHVNQLTAASEGLIQAFANGDSFKGFIDIGTDILKLLTSMVDSIGGGGTAILGFGSILTKVFGKQIANEISSFVINLQRVRENATALAAQKDLVNVFGNIKINDSLTQQFINYKQHVLDLGNAVSQTQQEALNSLLRDRNQLQNQKQAWISAKTEAEKYYQSQTGKTLNLENEETNFRVVLSGLSKIQRQSNKTTNEINKISEVISDLGKRDINVKNFESSLQKIINKTQDIINNNKIEGQSYESLKQALQEYELAIQQAKNEGLEGEDIINQASVQDAISTLLQNLQIANNEIKNGAENTAKTVEQAVKGTAKNIDIRIENTEKNILSLLHEIDTKAAVQSLVNLASSVGQVAFAFQSFKNIKNIIDNNDLSNGEKALQLAQNFSMLLPSLVSGIKGVVNGFSELKIALGMASVAGSTLLLVLGGLGLAVAAAVKIYDALHISTEEMQQSINKANEEKTKLENLNSELETTKKRIEELEAKGSLEITDAQQLIQLKAQNAELQAQIALQKQLQKTVDARLAKDAREAAEQDIYANNLTEGVFKEDLQVYNGSPQFLPDRYRFTAGGGWFSSQPAATAQLPQSKKIKSDITNISVQDRQHYNQWVSEMSEAIEYATQQLNKAYQASDGATSNLSTAWEYVLDQLTSDFKYYQTEWQASREEALRKAEENKKIALNVLPALLSSNESGINDDAIAYYQQKVKQYYEITGMWDQAVRTMAQTALSAEDRKKLIETIQQNQGKIDLNQLQNSLGKQVFEKISFAAETVGFNLDELISKYYELATASKTVTEDIKEPQFFAPNDISGFRSNLEKYQKGTLKNDDLKQFEGILNSLQDAYPNLIDKVQTLRKSWLAGTDEYQAALSAIEDTLSYNMIDASMQASEAATKAWDKVFHEQEEFDENGEPLYKAEVDLQLDDEEVAEFQDQLNNILNAEHAIDVEIHTDAEQAFEGIQSKFDQISKAAAKIGQGFIVAADDMRELNNVFPGIMENMQLLQNGTYQLNEDIVKNATNAAMSEAAAQAESVRSRLQDQSILLHKKAEIYENIAKAAEKLATSETLSAAESAQTQKYLADQLSQARQIDSQLAATKENADQKAVADSSQTNAGIMASNWAEGANAAAQSIYEFAEASVYNMAAVAQGKPEKLRMPRNISSSFGGGQSGSTQQLDAIEKAQNVIDSGSASKEAFADMAAQFQAMADASKQAANDIDGMLAQIGGNVNDIVTGIQDVQAGKAYGTTQKGDKSKKSGSGSTKDKTKTADQIEKKKLKDTQIDRYHELDRAIKDVQETIDDLNRAEGKTVRNGLSQTIDQQVAALEQQKGLYEQKIGLMQSDLQLMQSELSALGVQFDSQGNIVNYTALMIEYQRVYNGLLEEAKLLTGDQQQAKLNEAEAVKAKLDNLKSQMNAYEQLQDKIVDAGNAIQDIIDKEEELRIKQFKIQIDWQLDKAQAERDWNEFRKKVIDKIKEDDYLGQAQARLQDFFSYYKPDGGGIIQELTEHVNRTRQEAEIIENGGVSSVYGTNQAQALEDLKHYNDELMKNLEDVQEIAKDIHDLYLDTIDKANDAFEEQIAAYEQIDNIIEHDLNLIQMLQPVDNEEQLEKYYDLRRDNNNQQIDFYRKEVDMWKRQMDAAERGSDEWKKFRDNWMESVTDLNSAVEAAVQNLLDKYNNTIQKIINDSKDQLMGGDWKKALDEWDKAKWLDDRYLDMGSRANGVLDFISNVNKAMDGKSVKQQQQLLQLMDAETERLNNITNLSQTQVDIANKKLEILQKQMALEQAQESKTRLRLRRDSQGNYTYQYVADEDQIVTRQQELRDTLEELRQLVKEDISDTIDSANEKTTEFFDKVKELSQTYYGDQELLQEKIYELYDEYFGENGYLTLLSLDYNLMQAQLLEATGAQFSELYRQQGEELAAFLGLDTSNAMENSIWQSVLKLIGADSGEIPKLLTIFTTQVMQDNFNKMGEMNQNMLFGEGGMNPSWNTAIGNMASSYITLTNEVVLPAVAAMINATDVYANELQVLQQVAGISFANISQGIDYTIGETRQLIQDNGTLINSFEQEINAIAAVNAQIQALCAQYREAEAAAIAAAEAAMNFWATAQGVPAEVSSPSGGGYGGGSASVPESTSARTAGEAAGVASVQSAAVSSTSHQPPKINYRTAITSNGSTIGFTGSGKHPESSTISEIEMRKFGYKTPKGAAHFATGGYTGEWINGNDDGRLAFLHQKELVLNAEDTSNILSAVDIVRKLTNQIAGLNGLAFSGLPNSNIGGITNNNGNAIEQSVVIHANFPDVSEAAQIKQAFDNLVNIAVMRANQR